MKKIVISLLMPLILTGCDSLGIGKTSSVVELTQKIKVENSAANKLVDSHKDIVFHNSKQSTSFNISKNNIISVPAISKGIVYVLDQKGIVIAHSLKEKREIWSAKIDSSSSESFNVGNILYSSDKLYITNGTRELTIMSADNGEVILSKTFPDIIQTKPVMVDDKIVVVQTLSNQLIAFNTTKAEIEYSVEGDLGTISTRSNIAPFLTNGKIITSFNSGELICIDALSGSVKWTNSLTMQDINFEINGNLTPTVINATPVTDGNYIFIATSNSKLLKININSGEIAFSKNIEDIQSMTKSGDRLIVTTNGRQIAILKTQDGSVTWVSDLLNPEVNKRKIYPALFQAPFIVSDNMNRQSINVFSSGGELYRFILNNNGEFNNKAEILEIPKNVESYWISCCDNKLYLFNNKAVSF